MGQVYISYSQNHKEAARRIRDALEAWGHTVWMDDPDELFDQDRAEQLESGLREAQILVALLSPSSVKSRTVRREIAIAKSQGKDIIPVLVEPLPSVTESSAKYIDATGDLSTAIAQLVKIVDTRVTKTTASGYQPEATAAGKEEVEDRRLNPLVVLGFVAAIAVIVIFSIVALTRSPGKSTDTGDVQLTQVQSTAVARATEAAAYKSTADSQATTIAGLQQTQIAADQATPTDTPVPEITIAVETPASPVPVITIETPASSTPVIAVATNEPSPTPEILFTVEHTATPVPFMTQSGAATEVSGPNLLVNPGFESFVPYGDSGQVAQDWTPWFIVGDDMPSYQQIPMYHAAAPDETRIREGLNGQQLSVLYATFDGGLYQQVTGFSSGAALRFSVYAYVWSSNFENRAVSEDDGDVTIQVGIDPTGGTDGQSASVIWSEPVKQYDQFGEYTVTANASGDTVTVFVRAAVDFPVANNVVYLDDAALVTTQ
jgi:hypothetical protein